MNLAVTSAWLYIHTHIYIYIYIYTLMPCSHTNVCESMNLWQASTMATHEGLHCMSIWIDVGGIDLHLTSIIYPNLPHNKTPFQSCVTQQST